MATSLRSEVDSLVPFEKIISQDAGNCVWAGPITTDTLQEMLSNCEVAEAVPDEIRTLLQTARKLFVYGYFVCEFYPMADFMSVLTVESALMRKFEDHYCSRIKLERKGASTEVPCYEVAIDLLRKGWKLCDDRAFRGGFKGLITWAGRKGFLNDANRLADSLPRLRASEAHRRFQAGLPPGQAARMILFCTEIVNSLFPREDA